MHPSSLVSNEQIMLSFNSFSGDKSLVTDIDNPGPEFPLFPTHNRLSVDLQPADVLFIPALWFHNMKVTPLHLY